MNIDLSNPPADEEQYDDYKEEVIDNIVNKLNEEYKNAKNKKDLDDILKKYEIKVIRNKKRASPMQEKIAIKRRIIEFTIHEPEDIFDIDFYKNKYNIK